MTNHILTNILSMASNHVLTRMTVQLRELTQLIFLCFILDMFSTLAEKNIIKPTNLPSVNLFLITP